MGMGYARIESSAHDIESDMTLFLTLNGALGSSQAIRDTSVSGLRTAVYWEPNSYGLMMPPVHGASPL